MQNYRGYQMDSTGTVKRGGVKSEHAVLIKYNKLCQILLRLNYKLLLKAYHPRFIIVKDSKSLMTYEILHRIITLA